MVEFYRGLGEGERRAWLGRDGRTDGHIMQHSVSTHVPSGPATGVVMGHVDGVGRAGLRLAGGGAQGGEELRGEDGGDGHAGVGHRDDCACIWLK